MYSHIAALSGAVVKRAAEVRMSDGVGNGGNNNGATAQLPGWAVIVFFADFLVFAPVLLYIGYSLAHIYPTLAIVEDPQPPAYTAVSLSADSLSTTIGAGEDGAPAVNSNKADQDQEPPLTTTSLRRINRLLYATAGWTANFRGLGCALALDIASLFCGSVFASVLPRTLGVLVAALATVQLHTAWTHIVVTTPSPERFWRRLPPFGKTFRATWFPVAAYWAASQFTAFVPVVLAAALGLSQWDPHRPTEVPQYSAHAVWQSLFVLLATLASAVCLVLPAQVILVRVQASLLPADADTIVPFDRSFGGAVEPEVVTGKGYVDFVTAWKTFGRASWLRLLKLMGKIVAVALAVYVVFLAIVVPEFLLMLHTSQPASSG